MIGPPTSSIAALEQALAVSARPDGRDPAAAPVPPLPSASVDLRGLRIAVTTEEAPSQIGEVAGELEWLTLPWDITGRYCARAGRGGKVSAIVTQQVTVCDVVGSALCGLARTAAPAGGGSGGRPL